MITCPKCGKENQDSYKFCLGCGGELPRDAAPKPFAPHTPPHGMKAVSEMQDPFAAPAAAPAPAPAVPPVAQAPIPSVPRPSAKPAEPPAAEPSPTAPAGDTVTCPQCAHVNSTAFKFCASCGFNLTAVASAPAAAPAPTTHEQTPWSPSAPAQGPTPTPGVSWKLVLLRADGTDAGEYHISPQGQVVGRNEDSMFSADNYLSPHHAQFTLQGSSLFVRDSESLNGTYLRLKPNEPEKLEDGQMFRIGQEILRFDRLHPQQAENGVEHMGSPSEGYIGRITLITGRKTEGNAFPIPEGGIQLGRERGHVLFPEDGYVSGLHCSLTEVDGHMMLTDFESSNGSFVRLIEKRELHEGDVLLMGQQLFRVAS